MRYPFVGGGGAPAEDTDLSYRLPLPKFNKDLPYKGEVPYESPEPEQNPLERIIKKIGPTRMQGFLSALTAPVHEGESDFAVGLNSYLAGKQGYEDRLRALGGAAQKELIEERKVKAQETTAQAAADRAKAYGVWAGAGGAGAGRARSATDKIKEFMGLPPDQQKAGYDMGLYHHPSTGKEDNEDQLVKSLIDQSGGLMSPEEARFVAKVKPMLLQTRAGWEMGKIAGKDAIMGMTTNREYGVPRRARQILKKYGMEVEDILGLSSAPTADYASGPDSEEAVQSADNATIQQWLLMDQQSPQPVLTDVQRYWIQAELEARSDEEGDQENTDEEDTGPFGRNPEGE